MSLSGSTSVIGAFRESSDATGIDGDPFNDAGFLTGAAYIFIRDATGWMQEAFLKASNPGVGDEFGYSVAVSGETVIVGADFEDSNATGVDGDQANDSANLAGAAYIFESDHVGSEFCWSFPNATGSAANLFASGDAGSSLVLTSAPVPATTGLFIYGNTAQAGVPFGDGLLCVGVAIRRIHPATQASAATHIAELTIDYAAPYAPDLMATKYFQYWFRSGLATGAGYNTSNALAIEF